MASLATFVNRFVGVRDLAEAPPAVWIRTESPRLRAIANEDVYLFVKRIDNTTVVRAADPVARRARSRSVATGFVAALLVIAGLVPAAYNTMAGFTLQSLRQEQDKLKQQEAQLDLQEAKLLSYDRLEKLANSLKMVEPVPQQVQILEGTSKAEARNAFPFATVEVSAR
ncbi:MAG: cell division protein FtsL [Acidobacteriaceae bacterium]|nr:cell division protein FtsL [Acidobacteriaceae bacterium]